MIVLSPISFGTSATFYVHNLLNSRALLIIFILFFYPSIMLFAMFTTRQKKVSKPNVISNSLSLLCNLMFTYRIERLQNLSHFLVSFVDFFLCDSMQNAMQMILENRKKVFLLLVRISHFTTLHRVPREEIQFNKLTSREVKSLEKSTNSTREISKLFTFARMNVVHRRKIAQILPQIQLDTSSYYK